jgi:hypothetical protein
MFKYNLIPYFEMAKTYKEENSLDKLLNAIIDIPQGDIQLIKDGSIAEYLISGNSNDIKINKMELYSKKYHNSIEYYISLSVSNGKGYEPVLYFTKLPYINEEMLERQKPNVDLLGKIIYPEFSKAIDDYYSRKSLEYKFEIKYMKKGDWIKDVIKLAKIKEEEFSKFDRMFDAWGKKGSI